MSKTERGIRAKHMVAMSIGLVDRLRILFTGRVVLYATGVKPYCEIYLATRLPRDPQQRAGVVQAMKAARNAGTRERGSEGVVEAPAADVRPKGSAPVDRGRTPGSAGPLAPAGRSLEAVPLPRVSPVARDESGGVKVCGCTHPKRAHRKDGAVAWCDLCPNPKLGSRRMHAFGLYPGVEVGAREPWQLFQAGEQVCTREQPHDGPCNGLPCDTVRFGPAQAARLAAERAQ